MAKPKNPVKEATKPLQVGKTKRTMGDNIKKKSAEANPSNLKELGLKGSSSYKSGSNITSGDKLFAKRSK